MKNALFFLALALFTFSACQKDDETPQEVDNILQYDGPNQTGPLLEAGNHEAAVRFTSTQTTPYLGKQLTAVRFFMGLTPAAANLKIYDAGTADAPGALLYSANVLPGMKTGEWTDHILGTPIDITGDDLWISISLKHDVTQQSIGCDAGPNKTNGDWLFSDSDNDWITYINRTGESVNWNIRGVVGE
ncbi:MAG: hypothetical protein DHS20C18_02030 [Saprospiraceae bacterium]|nr:MAG: hypothetical protein DHS20C18_02030 [Saprospiraceae bacterium]